MSDVNFGSLLSVSASKAKRLPPLPPGTYHVRVNEGVETGKSENKGTPFLRFKLTVLAPDEDVDVDEYEGGLEKIVGRTLVHTFWLPVEEGSDHARPDMVAQVREFMEDCGITFEDDEEVGSKLPELTNAECKVSITHRPSPNNPENMLVDISGSAPA